MVESSEWNRVKDLFGRALSVAQAERRRFVEANGGGAGTIAEVLSLLAVYEEARNFLEDPPAQIE